MKDCYAWSETMGCRLENFGSKCDCVKGSEMKTDKAKRYMAHEILEIEHLDETVLFVRAEAVEQLEQEVKELEADRNKFFDLYHEADQKLPAAEKEIERLKQEAPKCQTYEAECETLGLLCETLRIDCSCCYDKDDLVKLIKNEFSELQSENATLKAQLEKCKEQRLTCYNSWPGHIDFEAMDAELAQLRKDK